MHLPHPKRIQELDNRWVVYFDTWNDEGFVNVDKQQRPTPRPPVSPPTAVEKVGGILGGGLGIVAILFVMFVVFPTAMSILYIMVDRMTGGPL